MGSAKKKGGRKEPLFGLPAALADLRLTAADRIPDAGDDKPKKPNKRKSEPADDEPPRERKAPAKNSGGKRRSKSSLSAGLGRLVYWGVVLSLWGVIAVIGVVI